MRSSSSSVISFHCPTSLFFLVFRLLFHLLRVPTYHSASLIPSILVSHSFPLFIIFFSVLPHSPQLIHLCDSSHPRFSHVPSLLHLLPHHPLPVYHPFDTSIPTPLLVRPGSSSLQGHLLPVQPFTTLMRGIGP